MTTSTRAFAFSWSCFLCLGVLTALVSFSSARGAGPAGDPFAAQDKVALEALDADIARYLALCEKYDEPRYKPRAREMLESFKARIAALRTAYAQHKYDEVERDYEGVRFDLNLECQRLAVAMEPLRTPPPPPKTQSGSARIVYTLNPSPANKSEVAAALTAVDAEIKRLDTKAADPAKMKAIKERRIELNREFTKPRWDALLGDLKALPAP